METDEITRQELSQNKAADPTKEIRSNIKMLRDVIDQIELKNQSIDDLLKLSENIDEIKNEFDNYFFGFQASIRKTIKAKTSAKNE